MLDPYEIPPEEDLVTPERFAKGDLEVAKNHKGRIHRALPRNLTIIKELIRRDVFPLHYEIYGVNFLELRNAYRAPLAARLSAVLLEQWGAGVSHSWASSIYQRINKSLGRPRIRVVEFVLEESQDRENPQDHELYKESFEMLIGSIDEERERIQEEMRYGIPP